MDVSALKLKIMTQEGTLFDGEALSVAGRSTGGEFEILPDHGTWVSPTEPCCLRVRLVGAASEDGRSVLPFAVHGGVIEVHPDSVLVLADAAEAGADIDEERAGRARARAEGRLKQPSPAEGGRRGAEAQAVDVERARRALARALARLEAHGAVR